MYCFTKLQTLHFCTENLHFMVSPQAYVKNLVFSDTERSGFLPLTRCPSAELSKSLSSHHAHTPLTPTTSMRSQTHNMFLATHKLGISK